MGIIRDGRLPHVREESPERTPAIMYHYDNSGLRSKWDQFNHAVKSRNQNILVKKEQAAIPKEYGTGTDPKDGVPHELTYHEYEAMQSIYIHKDGLSHIPELLTRPRDEGALFVPRGNVLGRTPGQSSGNVERIESDEGRSIQYDFHVY